MVSIAKPASSMPPCAADRLDEMLDRLFTVWDRRFDTAPNFERWMLTVLIALSMAVMAAIVSEGLSRVGPDDDEDELSIMFIAALVLIVLDRLSAASASQVTAKPPF